MKRWLLSVVLVGAFGCSEASQPKESLVPVKGFVRIAGQPAPGVRLLFSPTGTTPGTGAFGLTDAEGNYELIHRSQEKGIVPGEYVVTFSRFLTTDGKPLPPNQSPFTSGARESIPARWSDLSKQGSHNKVTVSTDGKNLDFGIPKS